MLVVEGDEELNVDRLQFRAALPLLSAWGKAIEAGEDATEQYEALMNLRRELPDVFEAAVLFAESSQKRILGDCKTPHSGDAFSDHPWHRLRRLQVLKELFVPDQWDLNV